MPLLTEVFGLSEGKIDHKKSDEALQKIYDVLEKAGYQLTSAQSGEILDAIELDTQPSWGGQGGGVDAGLRKITHVLRHMGGFVPGIQTVKELRKVLEDYVGKGSGGSDEVEDF